MTWSEIAAIIGITALLGTNITTALMLVLNSRKPWEKPMGELRGAVEAKFVDTDKRLVTLEERHLFTLQHIAELRSLVATHVRDNTEQLRAIDSKVTDLYHVLIPGRRATDE